MLSCKALSPEELPYKGLAGGYIAVALYPYAAVGLVSALLDLFLNPLKKLRIVFENHIAVAGGALDESVFGILLH